MHLIYKFVFMSITCYLVTPRGFCSGVKRAINMAHQVLKLYGKVYIIEDIIHNKVFMKNMLDDGIIKVSSIDDVPDGATVMFSAHGISPSILDKAEKKELTIVDGTCPTVKAVQSAVKKSSEKKEKIIIIGNRSHPEIVALLGYANNKDIFVVCNEIDIDLLPDLKDEQVVYFTQTTLDVFTVKKIIDSLKIKFPHIKSDTDDNICNATKDRQNAVRKIANLVDLFIIVGSSYSSNSKRLAEVASECGAKKVIMVDSKDEIDLGIFSKNISNIAITSGASAPEFLVEEIIEFLKTNLDITIEEFENC